LKNNGVFLWVQWAYCSSRTPRRYRRGKTVGFFKSFRAVIYTPSSSFIFDWWDDLSKGWWDQRPWTAPSRRECCKVLLWPFTHKTLYTSLERPNLEHAFGRLSTFWVAGATAILSHSLCSKSTAVEIVAISR
jgi:hypothetical protein